MIWVFWLCLLFLAYTFAGYPLLLGILALVRNRTHRKAAIQPTVSIIIPVHNGAHLIAGKIENTFELKYPEDKREVIVASDGSSDSTPDIVRSYADRGVKLVEVPEKRGKHYAQMVARDVAEGEILVFTDAGVRLEPGALEEIVSNFADPSVGCVSSEDCVATSQNKKGPKGEGSYVELEMWVRRLESRVNSLVGASGSFFAARRAICDEWHPDMSSDFFVPLHAVKRGLRAVVDPACCGFYGIVRTEAAEVQRKVRTVVHGLAVFFEHPELLNPVRYGLFAWQFASHKLFRWLTPFALLGMLVSNVFLWNAGLLYRFLLVLQGCLYGAGLLALVGKSLTHFKPFKLSGFFLLGSVATLVAWFRFLSGEKYAAWQPSRRD